jgi:hypothetical protein
LLKSRLTRKSINDPGGEVRELILWVRKSASLCDSEWLMLHGLHVLQELMKNT